MSTSADGIPTSSKEPSVYIMVTRSVLCATVIIDVQGTEMGIVWTKVNAISLPFKEAWAVSCWGYNPPFLGACDQISGKIERERAQMRYWL